MGINDEYSRDAFNYTLAYDSDDSDEGPEQLGPEDWQDWHSEELLDAWTLLVTYHESMYLRTSATYPKFVQFVMNSAHGPMPRIVPTITEETMWNMISNIRIIKDNVQNVQFYEWIRKNINRNCNV